MGLNFFEGYCPLCRAGKLGISQSMRGYFAHGQMIEVVAMHNNIDDNVDCDLASDLRTIRLLNAEYVRSVEERDVDWFKCHLSSNFANSNPDGTIITRDQFLSQVAVGSGLSNIEAKDVKIRIFDDFAVVHASSTFLLASGKTGTGRYTDIWWRMNASWLCIAAQVIRC